MFVTPDVRYGGAKEKKKWKRMKRVFLFDVAIAKNSSRSFVRNVVQVIGVHTMARRIIR